MHAPGLVIDPPTPRTSRRRRARAGVAVAALAVLVGGAACSSTEEPSSAGTSTTVAAPAEAGGGEGGSTSSVAPTPPADDGSTTTVTVAAHGPLPEVELGDAEQAYVDALMSEQLPDGMDEEQARCIASHWIDAIGADAVQAAGVTPEGITAGTSSISDIPVDRKTAEVIVDSYEICEFDLVGLVVTGFTPMVQGDPTKLACLERVVTPELARDYMTTALMASETNPPDMAAIQAQLEPCLT